MKDIIKLKLLNKNKIDADFSFSKDVIDKNDILVAILADNYQIVEENNLI